MNTFLQLAAEKKYSKNGAAGNFFGPSYFVTALGNTNHFLMTKKLRNPSKLKGQLIELGMISTCVKSIDGNTYEKEKQQK